MKSDANIKVPRAAYDRAKAYVVRSGRDLRAVVGVALDAYVTAEEAKTK